MLSLYSAVPALRTGIPMMQLRSPYSVQSGLNTAYDVGRVVSTKTPYDGDSILL